MGKSGNAHLLKVSMNQVNNTHRRRSNITFSTVMDPDIEQDTKMKRRHSRKLTIRKNHKNIGVSYFQSNS